MVRVKIRHLYCYPVKSLGGISLQNAELLTSGIRHDRQWAIVREDGRPLTQRTHPKLALITPKITENGLHLSAPGFGSIDVDNPAIQDKAPAHPVQVWKDQCFGALAPPAVGEWLGEYLEERQALALARIHDGHQRIYNDANRFDIASHYFSDAAPYLIANHESLVALNAALEHNSDPQVDIRHFRANIVIEGIPAFSEHNYTTLNLNNRHHLQLIDHCKRCAMITVDPDTGEFLPKALPFKTLSQLNSMPDSPKAPAFGVNATLKHTAQSLASGDTALQSTLKVGEYFDLL